MSGPPIDHVAAITALANLFARLRCDTPTSSIEVCPPKFSEELAAKSFISSLLEAGWSPPSSENNSDIYGAVTGKIKDLDLRNKVDSFISMLRDLEDKGKK